LITNVAVANINTNGSYTDNGLTPLSGNRLTAYRNGNAAHFWAVLTIQQLSDFVNKSNAVLRYQRFAVGMVQ
jgi:hypothetical protein